MVSFGRSVARIPKREWILIGTVIVAACAAALVIYLDRPLQSATGVISHTLCSGAFERCAVFVEGLGCILVHGSEPASGIAPVRTATGEHAAPPLLKEIAGTAVVGLRLDGTTSKKA